jgi:hypothetical protein
MQAISGEVIRFAPGRRLFIVCLTVSVDNVGKLGTCYDARAGPSPLRAVVFRVSVFCFGSVSASDSRPDNFASQHSFT